MTLEIVLEKVKSNINGTIIDIETIGDFCREHPYSDSRNYKKIIPVIFGYINNSYLKIIYVNNHKSISELKEYILKDIDNIFHPMYAYSCYFEKGVLYNWLDYEFCFDGELNKKVNGKFQSKRDAIYELNIPNYDDPFNDSGLLCLEAWQNGNVKDTIRHNRSCLLKERDILQKRGFREPDPFEFKD